MEVQETILIIAVELWRWTATLNYTHFIAMAVCYAFGYWLRGHRHDA